MESINATLIAVAKSIKNQILYHDQQIAGMNSNRTAAHLDVVTDVRIMQDRVRDLEESMANANISDEKTIKFVIQMSH